MQVVDRAAWGAQPPKGQYTTMKAGAGVCIHWEGGATPTGGHEECAPFVLAIQKNALANTSEGYIDIPYNLLVCPHGYVFIGRGVGIESAAQGNYNSTYYSICALDGPTGGATEPTPELSAALVEAIDELRATGGATTKLVCHSDLMSTDCPGDTLRTWVHSNENGVTPAPPSTGLPEVALGSRSLEVGVSAGTDVQFVQQAIGVPDDGQFGTQTQGGVMCWQHLHNLSNDGQVGKDTWASLGHPMS
jgi:peptidoglycan hydrolase-like protein with peptidoglycan-binding domain